VDHLSLEPRALEEEVDFVLKHAARYMQSDPTRDDVLSVFAGLRPLVRPSDARSTAAISRDHHLSISRAGLITITGGKWTTYRKMGEDTIDQATSVGGLEPRESKTAGLRLHGAEKYHDEKRFNPLRLYGGDGPAVLSLAEKDPTLAALIHPCLPYIRAEVVWAARHELARTVEDVLARRTRALLLDARASIASAEVVAKLLASELDRDDAWMQSQVQAYSKLAQGYLLT
jgi:glycerol-3-phosphate dehydrogenase